MVLFSRVDSGMSCEMAAGCESAIAGGADVLLLRQRILDDGDYLLWLQVGISRRLRIRCGIAWVVVAAVILQRRFPRHVEQKLGKVVVEDTKQKNARCGSFAFGRFWF